MKCLTLKPRIESSAELTDLQNLSADLLTKRNRCKSECISECRKLLLILFHSLREGKREKQRERHVTLRGHAASKC